MHILWNGFKKHLESKFGSLQYQFLVVGIFQRTQKKKVEIFEEVP
jgi:hypothetical protein